MNTISKLNIYIILILGIVLFSACDDTHTDPDGSECTFIQNDDDMDGLIDDTEQSIMEDCLKNRLTDKDEIKSNLTGEWIIVGHGEGWMPTVSQPCGKIIFTESGYTFDYESETEDKTTMGTWNIIENDSGYLLLEVSESNSYPLNISIFCEDYMYFNHTPSDGNMYIYQKM